MINDMLASGKRVVVPYCKENCNELGIAEIRDMEKDLVRGEYGILEPRAELRDLFSKAISGLLYVQEWLLIFTGQD